MGGGRHTDHDQVNGRVGQHLGSLGVGPHLVGRGRRRAAFRDAVADPPELEPGHLADRRGVLAADRAVAVEPDADGRGGLEAGRVPEAAVDDLAEPGDQDPDRPMAFAY